MVEKRRGGAENHDSTSTMQDHSVVDTVPGWDVAAADARGGGGSGTRLCKHGRRCTIIVVLFSRSKGRVLFYTNFGPIKM
jgi:hypothetical protein